MGNTPEEGSKENWKCTRRKIEKRRKNTQEEGRGGEMKMELRENSCMQKRKS